MCIRDSTTNQLEEFFESRHDVNAEHAATTYGLDYFKAGNKDELDEAISHFFKEKPKASILEIFTPTEDNDKILGAYFKHINKALGI